jgi:hypothetical protein
MSLLAISSFTVKLPAVMLACIAPVSVLGIIVGQTGNGTVLRRTMLYVSILLLAQFMAGRKFQFNPAETVVAITLAVCMIATDVLEIGKLPSKMVYLPLMALGIVSTFFF